jgi:uncharacterized membrane protein
MTMITLDSQDRASRLLLVGSLALNLFFVGTAGALTARHYIAPTQPAPVERSRTAAARVERLAAPLPAADAEKLRAAFRERAGAAEGARDALNAAFERVSAALRAEPFDPAALGTAFSAARAARPAYELAMQQIIAAGAQAMSHEGRSKLAEWPPSRPNTNTR